MYTKTLTELFASALFRIPDYQRGYAWEEKQWKDFIQDIDALVDEPIPSHYTGTVVVFAKPDNNICEYGPDSLSVVDVVDGQQRLTTSCLYLAEIIRALLHKGELAYEQKISVYLYSGMVCRLTLNNDTGGIFYDLLKLGRANTAAQSPHEKRLVAASSRFRKHIDTQLAARGEDGVAYLKGLCQAITQKLHYTYYPIDDPSEIGMTFELMNSRGKGLSVLELLKNYLMHWAYRNEPNMPERNAMTSLINKNWKDAYTNLGSCSGNEDQCLRIAWTLYCNPTPGNWNGYDGFKGDRYVPLRNWTERTKGDTKAFIVRFADGLADISSHYASISTPTERNTLSKDELLWLTKIHHSGNIANFLPLMVAARKHRAEGGISEAEYIDLLKALECYAYRVFLFSGRRSNAGKSSFFRWGNEIFAKTRKLNSVTAEVYGLTRYYSPEELFVAGITTLGNWYGTRHRLRYTLYEYELHLLRTEGKDMAPHLKWEELNDSTIEHIFPQTPKKASHWLEEWRPEEIAKCLHDLGNLVLTQNNSNYLNFEFDRKRGRPGQSPSYINSDIRQERKIADYTDWTPAVFNRRRQDMEIWLKDRWKTVGSMAAPISDISDEEDEDGSSNTQDHSLT